MFADMGIVHSMQAAAVVADKSKGGKQGEEGGVISACCQWLLDQHAEGLLVHGSPHMVDAAVDGRDASQDVSLLGKVANAAEHAEKKAAAIASRRQSAWRPMLQAYEDRCCKQAHKSQDRTKSAKEMGGVKQPLLWRELALLLMLQAAALESALKCAARGDGWAPAHRSQSASPLKHATPTAGKPSRIHAGGPGSPVHRGSIMSSSPMLPAPDADVGDSPSTPKSFIPEENKQQQQQQQQHHWQTALYRLPYVDDGTNGGIGGNSGLLPLMQQLKVSHLHSRRFISSLKPSNRVYAFCGCVSFWDV
jgi:hypothetical protein